MPECLRASLTSIQVDVQEGHAALRQLLQPPGQPASLAPPLPQALRQYPQQQLRPPAMHSLAPGPPGTRPLGGPAPGQAYSQAAPGVHAGYVAQRPYAPGFQQQGVRSGAPGPSAQVQVVCPLILTSE